MMVEVTKADRDAAQDWENRSPETSITAFKLTQRFATRYQAGIAEGRRQMREEAAGVAQYARDRRAILAIPIGDES